MNYIVLGDAISPPPPPPPPAATRTVFDWPFASNSPWNIPIGDATYANNSDIHRPNNVINTENWTTAICQAVATDPLVAVTNLGNGGDASIRIAPMASTAAGRRGNTDSGRDKHFWCVQPDGRTCHEFWHFNRTGTNTATCEWRRQRDIVTGFGFVGYGCTASDGSNGGGMMREWELILGTRDRFKHAICLALSRESLKATAPRYIWPATNEDTDFSLYAGTIPMGALLAIPKSVNLDGLGLNSHALALAQALQDFGGYITKSAGTDQLTFYAEVGLNAAASAVISSIRSQLGTIAQQLRWVTDNAENSVGGGAPYPSSLYPAPDPVP